MSLRALIWCAVSTRVQAEDDKLSLPQQEIDARSLCQKEEWRIVDVLRVPGHSRYYLDLAECASDMRVQGIDAFDKLLVHLKTQDFDVFICRDSERFARSQALHARVVEEIIRTGARIYSFADGWVNQTNFRMFIAMAGYKAASDVDRLVKGRQIAMDERARRGLPTSSGVPMSHRLVRDENGKALYLVVDESRRSLWNDFAALVVEGTGWRNMERELFNRFGHTNEYGEQWHMNRMYALVTNPTFWGHSARYHRHKTKKHAPVGPWILEEGHDIPPGVVIYYNTHDPVFTGEIATNVKAEMKRRFRIIKGSTSPRKTHWAAGLFICGECGYRMTYFSEGNGKASYMKCMSHWSQSATRSDCSQRKGLRLDMACEYATDLLNAAVDANAPEIIAGLEPKSTNEGSIQRLSGEIAGLEAQIKRMIRKQAEAGDDVHDLYAEQIEVAGTRLKVLKSRIEAEELSALTYQQKRVDRDRAFEMVKESVEDFWTLPETTINQLLHRLMQNKRFVVLEAEIIGVSEVAERRGKRRRGRIGKTK